MEKGGGVKSGKKERVKGGEKRMDTDEEKGDGLRWEKGRIKGGKMGKD